MARSRLPENARAAERLRSHLASGRRPRLSRAEDDSGCPVKSRLSVIDGNEDGEQSSPARLPRAPRGKGRADAGDDKQQDGEALLGRLDGESFIGDGRRTRTG